MAGQQKGLTIECKKNMILAPLPAGVEDTRRCAVVLKPGWLNRQFDEVSKTVAAWPDWMKRAAGVGESDDSRSEKPLVREEPRSDGALQAYVDGDQPAAKDKGTGWQADKDRLSWKGH